jgi:hypothetical protein
MAISKHGFVQLLALFPAAVSAMVVSEKAQLTRSLLTEALRSPAGKLTLSPEMVIPEPSDPTAILLQSSAVSSMSEKIRVEAKANSAWISGSLNSLATFCNEQERSRGNFPGPVPVIYCDAVEDFSALADAGAAGVLVPIFGGELVASLDDLTSDTTWVETCKGALEFGVQPIPEITIADTTAESWKEEGMEALINKISEIAGADPVAVLMTVNPTVDDDDEEEGEPAPIPLPTPAKALGKRVPIIGSVRAKAGGNRMGTETSRFKDAGYTGALLRSDCIPGFRMNPDLEYVAKFWSACIGDLKSLKSKSFNFRSRNWMNSNSAIEWAKYQHSIIESGALGEMEDNTGSGDLNPDNGDYMGF